MVTEEKITLFSTIAQQPKSVGGYDITGRNGKENSIIFTFHKKPRWHHRFFTRIFLGWTWVDYK